MYVLTRLACSVPNTGANPQTTTFCNEMGHGKHHSLTRLSCTGTNIDIRRPFHGIHAPTQDTCDLHLVLLTTEPIGWVLMQTMMLRQMKNAFIQSSTDITHLVSDDEEEGSTTSSATNPEITVNGMREENIANFMTKDLLVQPTNIIADEDKPLATKNPQAELL
jgi:hypothetical protein